MSLTLVLGWLVCPEGARICPAPQLHNGIYYHRIAIAGCKHRCLVYYDHVEEKLAIFRKAPHH